MNYIINLRRDIVQHVEHVFFGEVFLEESNNKWNTPYLFNGKERETRKQGFTIMGLGIMLLGCVGL